MKLFGHLSPLTFDFISYIYFILPINSSYFSIFLSTNINQLSFDLLPISMHPRSSINVLVCIDTPQSSIWSDW
jgi:hypothetical protein